MKKSDFYYAALNIQSRLHKDLSPISRKLDRIERIDFSLIQASPAKRARYAALLVELKPIRLQLDCIENFLQWYELNQYAEYFESQVSDRFLLSCKGQNYSPEKNCAFLFYTGHGVECGRFAFTGNN